MKFMKASRILLILFLFIFTSCGDIFNIKRKVVDNYYLVQGEGENNYTICLRMTEGDYVVRIPAQILEYGWSDSFFVGKIKDQYDDIEYYILNRKIDSDSALEKDVKMGPFKENEFQQRWGRRVNVTLVKTKY